MDKNWLIAIVAVLVILAAGSYVLRNQAATSPIAAPEAGEQRVQSEVNLTDQGFSPATITVKKGETVKFTNKSSSQMWVASDPHPTHTDYPGFDELQMADSYSFTFDNVGTWGFHNHLNPSTKGTVVVTE